MVAAERALNCYLNDFPLPKKGKGIHAIARARSRSATHNRTGIIFFEKYAYLEQNPVRSTIQYECHL